ncbi:MAG: MBL fold metallo-hydrolase [Chitinophagaceae bacterium]|nr:MBL fold metallo-hydrolase [Chitinophagaceae bacterium]
MKQIIQLLIILALQSCHEYKSNKTPGPVYSNTMDSLTHVSVIVLGTIQDAGSPQIGCTKNCCKSLFENPDKNRMVVSLGLVDPVDNKKYIFEAGPDFVRQTKILKNYSSPFAKETPDGIFLTHAHIGHYTGLMYLGKEAMNADSIPVYVMPRMKVFLEQNGPWSQLVKNRNIILRDLHNGEEIKMTGNIKVQPFTVPHRDEFSETVGYKIIGPNKKLLFIPDIDKWEKWSSNIADEIAKVDYAFVDATFFDSEEINNRDISTIPHPFIIESMNLFRDLPAAEKKKIYFIHFNHTNPVINKMSLPYKQVVNNGFNVAQINTVLPL